MRVALLFNPRSGSGRAGRLAGVFARALADAGHEVAPLTTHDEAGNPRPPLTPADLDGVGLLAVVGGDGTIHRAGPVAAGAGCPLYHVPAGTENLFARHYAMTREPRQLLRALARGRTASMDVAQLGGAGRRHPFLLMASVGPDAGVIHRLHGSRTGIITQWSYLRPVLEELLEPRLPLLSVAVDGHPWLSRVRGLLVVGNSPHYAWGLNPARAALADDGLLDAAFYPADTIVDMVHWAARLLLRREGPLEGTMTRRGRVVEVVASDPRAALIQMDGEVGPAWSDVEEHGRVVFGIEGTAMRVLDPR